MLCPKDIPLHQHPYCLALKSLKEKQINPKSADHNPHPIHQSAYPSPHPNTLHNYYAKFKRICLVQAMS